jgi:hypothetical protein
MLEIFAGGFAFEFLKILGFPLNLGDEFWTHHGDLFDAKDSTRRISL